MSKLDAAQVAKLLRELAQRMELEGGNPYRVPRDSILNALDLDEFMAYLKARKKRRLSPATRSLERSGARAEGDALAG